MPIQAALDANPVDLSVLVTFATPPGGKASLLLPMIWTRDREGGDELIRDLTHATGGQLVKDRICAYRDSFDPDVQKTWPKGWGYKIRTRTIDRLDQASIDALIDGARRLPSPKDAIFLHDFHGEAARIAVDATAFPVRAPHFVVEIVSMWELGSQRKMTVGRDWVESFAASLSPLASPGGYPNLLGPDEGARVNAHFEPNRKRLLDTKERVDPRDLFRSAVGRLT